MFMTFFFILFYDLFILSFLFLTILRFFMMGAGFFCRGFLFMMERVLCSLLGSGQKVFTLKYSRDAEFSGIYRCCWFLRFVLGYVVLLQGF